MNQERVIINPDHFRDLARIHDILKPLIDVLPESGLYVDGKLTVRHVDDYEVGRFFFEDGFILFETP